MIIGQTIPSHFFTYSKDHKSFVAEASELGANGYSFMGFLYDDALDLGFVLMSDRTGNLADFYFVEKELVTDELVGWIFKPTAHTVKRYNLREGDWKVTIIND